MRPVFVREMKELSPALAVLITFGAIAGASEVGSFSDRMLAYPVFSGLVVGFIQGALDRWRRTDLFALHRPISAGRMEAARLFAGATAAAVVLLPLVVSHRIATLSEIAGRERQFGPYWIVIDQRAPPEQLGASEVILLGALLLGAWAVARFSVGTVRARWAVPALVALPLAGWALVADARTIPAAAGLALLLGTLFSLGSWLCLVGERR